ncbi:MAG TPA: trypsin-like peptidase domain-containing protein [Terriglobales bacterium]
MQSLRAVALGIAAFLTFAVSTSYAAQQAPSGRSTTAQTKPIQTDLKGLSASLQELTQTVGAAVVQINCTGLTITSTDNGAAGTISRQSSTGSGVLLSADGYIMTNAHVVANAHHIRVRLNGLKGTTVSRQQLEAKLIGVDQREDLALIKIDVTGLPFATLADNAELQQGQVVLAFGSPLGLENSVSLGVVSSTARQISPDDPRIFIQTDAAINPGNSGGPLVDANGHVVGINTFILSQSGGSEGIGFAIPSSVVQNIYTQLKATGHVHRGQIGVYVRTITPELKEGLHLPQDNGVLIEDVFPGGPADDAGMKIGDIVVSIGAREIHDVHHFAISLYRFQIGQTADIEVLRGGQKQSLHVKVADAAADPLRFADMVTQDNLVPRLGILGLTLTPELAQMVPDNRISTGVVVAARTPFAPYIGSGPQPGDIIHAVGTQQVATLEDLRAALAKIGAQDVIVLQVERSGSLSFLVLEQD